MRLWWNFGASFKMPLLSSELIRTQPERTKPKPQLCINCSVQFPGKKWESMTVQIIAFIVEKTIFNNFAWCSRRAAAYHQKWTTLQTLLRKTLANMKAYLKSDYNSQCGWYSICPVLNSEWVNVYQIHVLSFINIYSRTCSE